jgi:hypothetical protein
MDMSTITMRNTKAEMLEHIAGLEARLRQGGLDMVQLRTRISVLEGAAALKATPKAPDNIVRRGGTDYRVEVTKHGARTTKRYVPLISEDMQTLLDDCRDQSLNYHN